MSVTIVIPARDPSEKLLTLLDEIRERAENRIVIINDGSCSQSDVIFEKASKKPQVTLLRHAINMGKGQALKTAFNYILTELPSDTIGVVTADADGQHTADDILKLIAQLNIQPNHLSLGVRSFQGKVPLRSKIGNVLTRTLFGFFSGQKLQDTQTGLRAIPRTMLFKLLELRSRGFDFELDMLLQATHHHIPITQIPIITIYEDNNKSSHFNPVLDSIKIYFVLLRFTLLSLTTSGLDFIVFYISFLTTHNVLASVITARAISASINFSIGKTLVFRSSHSWRTEAIKYASLVVILAAATYGMITSLINFVGMNVMIAKILSESFLFILSFSFQRLFVFRRSTTYQTVNIKEHDTLGDNTHPDDAINKITIGAM